MQRPPLILSPRDSTVIPPSHARHPFNPGGTDLCRRREPLPVGRLHFLAGVLLFRTIQPQMAIAERRIDDPTFTWVTVKDGAFTLDPTLNTP